MNAEIFWQQLKSNGWDVEDYNKRSLEFSSSSSPFSSGFSFDDVVPIHWIFSPTESLKV